jgi:fructose-1,6-bisphosphatase class II
MKNHHLDIIRATEAAAISAAEWVGRGNKELADKAATDAMRSRLDDIDFRAQIAIGEGIKDGSFGLFEGDLVGAAYGDCPSDAEYDIAVDPIEGTTPTAKGGYEAMAVLAMGNVGSLYKTDVFYMDKIAVGPKVAAKAQIDLKNPASANVGMVAAALGKSPEHVTVCVLDRERTKPLVGELRKIGCRIKFISDCDVTACIATCVPDSGIDMYWSIGGAPEAVIAASAMKCMGGFLQCREVEESVQKCGDFQGILTHASDSMHINDLAEGEVMFAATGITDGKFLKGVRFTSNGPVTSSVSMRSESGTVRWLTTEHGN